MWHEITLRSPTMWRVDSESNMIQEPVKLKNKIKFNIIQFNIFNMICFRNSNIKTFLYQPGDR